GKRQHKTFSVTKPTDKRRSGTVVPDPELSFKVLVQHVQFFMNGAGGAKNCATPEATLMKPHRFRIATAILCASLVTVLCNRSAAAAERCPGASWERVGPEVAGWTTEKLAKAEAWSKRNGSTS